MRSILDGPPYSAYQHNGDHAAMTKLGLKTTGFMDDWTDLGTVEVEAARPATDEGEPFRPAATVKVEVSSHPAMFWRFTVTRPREEIVYEDASDVNGPWHVVHEPCEVFEVTTGSGGFTSFWPAAAAVAQDMLNVAKVEPS